MKKKRRPREKRERMLALAQVDPYACDGCVEVYMGEHATESLPQGWRGKTGDAFVDHGTLHITSSCDREDAPPFLKIPLPEQAKERSVARGSFAGRFPLGKGESLSCHAKMNLESGCVRVDSFDDLTLWFELVLQ